MAKVFKALVAFKFGFNLQWSLKRAAVFSCGCDTRFSWESLIHCPAWLKFHLPTSTFVVELMSAASEPSCFKAVCKMGSGLELVQVTRTLWSPVTLYCPSNPLEFFPFWEKHFPVLWLQLPAFIAFPEDVANLGFSFHICSLPFQ